VAAAVDVRWEKSSRVPRAPTWAVLAGAAWSVAALAAGAVGGSSPCLLRHATGLPCPTCGGTRSVLAAAHGDVPASLAANPLVLVLLATVFALTLSRAVTGRRVVVSLSVRGRSAAWTLSILLLLSNWAWVLVHSR
jgi:hypothetical protein